MRLIHIGILLNLIIIVFASCSNESGNSVTIDAIAVTGHDDTLNIIDTIVTDEPEIQEPDTILTYPLASCDDAMEFMKNSDHWDKYALGILPSLAEQNLDYTERLLKSPYNYFIIVDKPSMRVILFNRFGVKQQAYKMACSRNYGTKHKRRDNRTPEGFFEAEGVYDSTDWLYTDDDGYTSPKKGQFGPRFIRLKTDVSTQIGIHGTCAPWSLGRRTSHGCIRIHNDNILKLVEYVEKGMPIIVNPSARDIAVNTEEGYTVPAIQIGKSKEKAVAATAIEKRDSSEAATQPAAPPDTLNTDTITPGHTVSPDTITVHQTEE